jgi:hypothetical protein
LPCGGAEAGLSTSDSPAREPLPAADKLLPRLRQPWLLAEKKLLLALPTSMLVVRAHAETAVPYVAEPHSSLQLPLRATWPLRLLPMGTGRLRKRATGTSHAALAASPSGASAAATRAAAPQDDQLPSSAAVQQLPWPPAGSNTLGGGSCWLCWPPPPLLLLTLLTVAGLLPVSSLPLLAHSSRPAPMLGSRHAGMLPPPLVAPAPPALVLLPPLLRSRE